MLGRLLRLREQFEHARQHVFRDTDTRGLLGQVDGDVVRKWCLCEAHSTSTGSPHNPLHPLSTPLTKRDVARNVLLRVRAPWIPKRETPNRYLFLTLRIGSLRRRCAVADVRYLTPLYCGRVRGRILRSSSPRTRRLPATTLSRRSRSIGTSSEKPIHHAPDPQAYSTTTVLRRIDDG